MAEAAFTNTNTGGKIGPRRASLLVAMLVAYFSTSDDDRQDFDGLRGDNTNTILHPGLVGQRLTASDDDLQALADEGFVHVSIRDSIGSRHIKLLAPALNAYLQGQQPQQQPEPPRRMGFGSQGDQTE